jgi:hypothetical protein
MAVISGKEEVHLMLAPVDLLLALMICGFAWLFVWVLEEALTLKSDIDEYV